MDPNRALHEAHLPYGNSSRVVETVAVRDMPRRVDGECVLKSMAKKKGLIGDYVLKSMPRFD